MGQCTGGPTCEANAVRRVSPLVDNNPEDWLYTRACPAPATRHHQSWPGLDPDWLGGDQVTPHLASIGQHQSVRTHAFLQDHSHTHSRCMSQKLAKQETRNLLDPPDILSRSGSSDGWEECGAGNWFVQLSYLEVRLNEGNQSDTIREQTESLILLELERMRSSVWHWRRDHNLSVQSRLVYIYQ